MAPLFWFEVQLSINEGRRGQVLSFLGIISGSVFPRAGSGLTRSRH